MLYSITLSLHNLNRWVILFLGFWTTWQVTRAWLGHHPWQARYTTWIRLFAWVISLQFLLGLTLYLLPGALIQSVLQNIAWAQVIKDRVLRFFALEHPLQMFIAIALAHIALSTARRIKGERRRFAWTASLMIVAMLLIVAAIPWPGFYYARPWVRWPW